MAPSRLFGIFGPEAAGLFRSLFQGTGSLHLQPAAQPGSGFGALGKALAAKCPKSNQSSGQIATLYKICCEYVHQILAVTVNHRRKLRGTNSCWPLPASTASVFSGLYAVELLLDAGPTDRAQPEFAGCFGFFRPRARSLGHSLKRGRTIPARAQMPAIRCTPCLASLATLASSVRRTAPAGHKEDRFLELGADNAALAATLNRKSAILPQAFEKSRASFGYCSNTPTGCLSPKHPLAELSPAPLPEFAVHDLGKTGSLTQA